MERLFKQFSFPGGIPSHAAPETPGSIHEGGELGYCSLTRMARVSTIPDLIVVLRHRRRRSGDRPARRRAGIRTSSSIPARDGAVLPILHLNGYKIANPTVLARIAATSWKQLLRGLRLRAVFRRRRRPGRRCTSSWPRRSTGARRDPRRSSTTRASDGVTTRPRWPMIVLRTPEGLDRPEGSRRQAGRRHLARAPGAALGSSRRSPSICGMLEQWMRELPARGTVRRRRHTVAGAGRARPERRPAHGRESARQRRTAAARSAHAGFPRLRRRRCRTPGSVDGRSHARCWATFCAT